MKKPQEFHDNESEIISGESKLLCRCGTIFSVKSILMSLSPHQGCSTYSRAALIRGWRLFEGGDYSRVALILVNMVPHLARNLPEEPQKDTSRSNGVAIQGRSSHGAIDDTRGTLCS